MSMAKIWTTLTDDGVAAAQKLFHVLLMNVRGPALTMISERGITDMKRSIGMAGVDHEIRTEYSAESAKSHGRNPQCEALSLSAHSLRDRPGRMAGEYSQMGIDFGRSFQRVDEERLSSLTMHLQQVRIPLQMQSLDTFEAMTAVTLQFLQHNAQYQAGVTVSPNNKSGPDDMEIDAWTKQGKSHKGKGKSRTDGQKSSCYVCGRIGHMTKDCWFKDMNKVNTSKDCWFKDTSKGGPPSNRGKKGKGKGKGKGKNSVNEVTTPTESTATTLGGTTASTSQIARITQDDSL